MDKYRNMCKNRNMDKDIENLVVREREITYRVKVIHNDIAKERNK